MSDKAVFNISVPNPFQLRLMLLSHGWVDLLPFQWNEEAYCLHAVIRTHGDRAFALTLGSRNDNQPGQELEVFKTAGPRLTEKDKKILKERIRWCFRLDDDFRPFQERCAKTPGLEWVHKFGLGPFLRNTHPFEEFTKVLITTNINWGGTKSINNHLLTHLGDPVSPKLDRGNPKRKEGHSKLDDEPRGIAYPLPEKVAKKSERFLREKIRLG